MVKYNDRGITQMTNIDVKKLPRWTKHRGKGITQMINIDVKELPRWTNIKIGELPR